MNILQSEQGYTLLITLLALVILSIIGTCLMFLTTTAALRSESRESHTQALRLATIGETYLLASLEEHVSKTIEGGVDPDTFPTTLNNTIKRIKCTNPQAISSVSLQSGSTVTEACISNAVYSQIKNSLNALDPRYR